VIPRLNVTPMGLGPIILVVAALLASSFLHGALRGQIRSLRCTTGEAEQETTLNNLRSIGLHQGQIFWYVP
jgi:hypothetical protein